jgi:DNA-binding CsgD family transcriptional regulator
MTNRELTLVQRAGEPVAARGRNPDHEMKGIFGRSVIERDVRPRLIADASARLLWSSPSADRLLRQPFPVFIRKGRLCFEDGQTAQDGEAFLATLEPDGGRMLAINPTDGCWVLVSGWSEQLDNRRLLFLTFGLSQPTRDTLASGLAAHFGLTKAEATVLDHFACLRSPAEIARELHVTVNTVRSHLKRIHAKMAVTSSVRLLQIVRAFGDS